MAKKRGTRSSARKSTRTSGRKPGRNSAPRSARKGAGRSRGTKRGGADLVTRVKRTARKVLFGTLGVAGYVGGAARA